MRAHQTRQADEEKPVPGWKEGLLPSLRGAAVNGGRKYPISASRGKGAAGGVKAHKLKRTTIANIVMHGIFFYRGTKRWGKAWSQDETQRSFAVASPAG